MGWYDRERKKYIREILKMLAGQGLLVKIILIIFLLILCICFWPIAENIRIHHLYH